MADGADRSGTGQHRRDRAGVGTTRRTVVRHADGRAERRDGRPTTVRRASRGRDGTARTRVPPRAVLRLFARPPAGRLQGVVEGDAVGRLLPGPARRANADDGRVGPRTVLNQHAGRVAPRTPVPQRDPQRGVQHSAWQRELDASPRVGPRAPRARRGVGRDPTRGVRPEPVRHCLSGRDAGSVVTGWPESPTRVASVDPGGVPRPRVDERHAAGVLRLPRLADRAVGRAGTGRRL